MFGGPRRFIPTTPDSAVYTGLLETLTRLHWWERCLVSSEMPLFIFPALVLFALWTTDQQRAQIKTRKN